MHGRGRLLVGVFENTGQYMNCPLFNTRRNWHYHGLVLADVLWLREYMLDR
jgi:hypothetical protein